MQGQLAQEARNWDHSTAAEYLEKQAEESDHLAQKLCDILPAKVKNMLRIQTRTRTKEAL